MNIKLKSNNYSDKDLIKSYPFLKSEFKCLKRKDGLYVDFTIEDLVNMLTVFSEYEYTSVSLQLSTKTHGDVTEYQPYLYIEETF